MKDNIQRLLKLGLGRAELSSLRKYSATLRPWPPANKDSASSANALHSTSSQRQSKTSDYHTIMESNPSSRNPNSKRALQRIIAIKQREQRQRDERITSDFTHAVASKIRSQRYLAYNTTSNLHNKKFLKLLVLSSTNTSTSQGVIAYITRPTKQTQLPQEQLQ